MTNTCSSLARDTQRVDIVPLRRAIFRHFAETGRAPALAAEELTALETAHAAVLDEAGAIAFANPFANGPSASRVEADGRAYDAVCAWDALGILAALGTDGTVSTACPDCGESIVVDIHGGAPVATRAVVHFLVPARRWYEDLGFT